LLKDRRAEMLGAPQPSSAIYSLEHLRREA
jgi:hypothetical protein